MKGDQMSEQKEYIERAALGTILNEAIYNSCGDAKVAGIRYARDMLASIPPADVRPVVRGEWIDCGDVYEGANRVLTVYRCPVCGECFKRKAKPHFCENCGADMRKEER